MKKLVFIFAVSISSFLNAQCYSYTSLTQTQKKLLDKYDIDYTGLQTRYIMSTNQINIISDLETKNGMILSFSKFNKWNNNRLQIIPDTSLIIETASDYIQTKNLTEDGKMLKYFMFSSHNILQKIHIDINQDEIKSIEIIELHITTIKDCVHIYHMIFIENLNGLWNNLYYDTDITLDCPQCTVP
jgi:hypothetical protein